MSYAIFRLARAHRALAAGLLRELDLYPGQELLMMQLLDHDGLTQSELVESVGLDHSTVSKSLRRMQEAGLLVREPSTRDRRASLVHLTPKGHAMRGPLEELWRTLEETSAQNLTPGQADAFVDAARDITTALGRRTAGDGTV